MPRAEGEAAKLVQEAHAYKQQVVNNASGKAARFISVYNEYKVARDVTVKRIYLETMEEILGGMDKVIIDAGSAGGQGVIPYLALPEIVRRKQGGAE